MIFIFLYQKHRCNIVVLTPDKVVMAAKPANGPSSLCMPPSTPTPAPTKPRSRLGSDGCWAGCTGRSSASSSLRGRRPSPIGLDAAYSFFWPVGCSFRYGYFSAPPLASLPLNKRGRCHADAQKFQRLRRPCHRRLCRHGRRRSERGSSWRIETNRPRDKSLAYTCGGLLALLREEHFIEGRTNGHEA